MSISGFVFRDNFQGHGGQDTLISCPLHFLSRLRWSVLWGTFLCFFYCTLLYKGIQGQDILQTEWQWHVMSGI